MAEHKHYRIKVKASASDFYLEKLDTVDPQQVINSECVDAPVPEAVIGYWVDVLSADQRVLFRKYVNHLPTNLQHCWSNWGKRKRHNARYVIEVPALERAAWIRLYEQKIPAPGRRCIERHQHFQCAV